MLFLLCIMAITDRKNMGVPGGLEPVAFGLLLVLLGLTFGANCGYPLNPARDLAPRLFTAVAGYGGDCFSLVCTATLI
jgi:glycerol uptake facilitator-like aquaporin